MGVAPRVLKDVALNQDTVSELQLQQVLDCPMDSCVTRIADTPREWLEEVVAADLDVRGDEIANRRIGSPEHHVLARALQVVIDDLEWSRTIPATDRLRVGPLRMTLAQIRVDHGGGGAVERHTAA